MLRNLLLFCFLISFLPQAARAQGGTATVAGKVTDTLNVPLEGTRVILIGAAKGTTTDSEGEYSLEVPANQPVKLVFNYFNVSKKEYNLKPIAAGETHRLNVRMLRDTGNTVTIKGQRDVSLMKTYDPDIFEARPTTTGGFEDIIKTFAGVYSSNELSSQYSVRGGNYDENLVYINDIEIYRPQLVRSGQQEGLSIINSDMVKELKFSAGAFEAKYGDKLSSALDIRYKEPDSFSAKLSASFLGAFANVAGASRDTSFRYLIGARYRSNNYLLNTLDVQGSYRPIFADVQAWLSYELSPKVKLGYLSYFGSNRYLSIPETQETTFGTVTSVLRLKVFFDGQEILKYQNFLNGITVNYDAHVNHRFKFIASAYTSDERELFDIIGQYRLQQVESDLGSEDFGNVVNTLGVGGYLNHGRNILYSTIYNTEIKGYHSLNTKNELEWGLKFQNESIEDKLSEYRYIDSADYSVPQRNRDQNKLEIYEYIYSRNKQSWNRYMGYVQNLWNVMPQSNGYINVGARFNYWDYNKELLISPRIQFSFEPNARHNRFMIMRGMPDSVLKKRILLKVSAGIYNQPPFYRELRSLNGMLNPEIRAQKSWQFVAGGDMDFKIWDRPFKGTAEVYYKHLTDVIPYEVDNVRIRYYAENSAVGYATGLDLQLNGELVPDATSTVSISFMRTAEDILDDSVAYATSDTTVGYRYPGYIPRPTDQLFRFALYFEDYLPSNPTYKVHLNLVFASGLPYGPPDYQRYKDTLRVAPYRRADIGFSKMLYKRVPGKGKSKFLKNFESIWLSAEIFNVFQINNTVAYLWIKDTQGSDFAVPRYLTTRRLNLHLQIKF